MHLPLFFLLHLVAYISAAPVPNDSILASLRVAGKVPITPRSDITKILAAPPAKTLLLPSNVKEIIIDIGPNDSPLPPPANKSVAVLAVEPNVGVAHHLREKMQKKYPGRFFVVSCALSGKPLAGSFSNFHYYNNRGQSSSLSTVKRNKKGKMESFADGTVNDPSGTYGPGPAGMDVVPVLSLQALLDFVPENVKISMLRTDAQGHDLGIIKSVSPESLKRVYKIVSETYLPGIEEKRYVGVQNDLERDWVPYMKKVGFALTNPTNAKGREHDAEWIQSANAQ